LIRRLISCERRTVMWWWHKATLGAEGQDRDPTAVSLLPRRRVSAVAEATAVFELPWRRQQFLWWWAPPEFVFIDETSCSADQWTDGCAVTISRWGVTRLVTLPSYVCVIVLLTVWHRVYICIFCLLYMTVFLSIKVYIFTVFNTVVSVSLGPPTRYIIIYNFN